MFSALSLLAARSQTSLDKPADFLVKLGNAVGGKVSHPGDRVTAVIISPERFLGGRLVGSVDAVSAGSDGKMSFTFRQLEFKGSTLSIVSKTSDFVNSKGHSKVDEDERPLRVEDGVLISTYPDFVLDEGAETKLRVSVAH